MSTPGGPTPVRMAVTLGRDSRRTGLRMWLMLDDGSELELWLVRGVDELVDAVTHRNWFAFGPVGMPVPGHHGVRTEPDMVEDRDGVHVAVGADPVRGVAVFLPATGLYHTSQ